MTLLLDYNRGPLAIAVATIAGHCDGAVTDDGIGFDGTDTRFGRNLAMTPAHLWTDEMVADAYEMMRKYQRQLERSGVAFDDIPEPPQIEIERVVNDFGGTAKASRLQAKKIAGKRSTRLTVEGRQLILAGPYDGERIARVRQIPGRRWTGKVDTFPISSITALLELADEFGWTVDDEVHLLAGSPDTIVEMAKPVRTARIRDGRLILQSEWNQDLISEMRRLPGARWNAADKVWEVDILQPTIDWCFAHTFEITDEAAGWAKAEADRIDRLVTMSKAETSTLTIDGIVPGSLREFQLAGVEYILNQRRTWIGDEMGLGKTRQALAATQASDRWPLLIVCPMTVKKNWVKELGMVLPGRTAMILEGTKPTSLQSQLIQPDMYVINYDILPHWIGELLKFGFRAVAFDESHEYLSNEKLDWTKASIALGRQVAADTDGLVMLITGTPIRNEAKGLVAQIETMCRMPDLGGRPEFLRRYIKRAVTNGFDPELMIELHNKLRAVCYLRREKHQVAKELLPKDRQPMIVELSDAELAEYRKAEADIVEYLRRRAFEAAVAAGQDPTEEAMKAALRAERAKHLVTISNLKQLAAKARLPHAMRWIEQFKIETGRKLIVFGWHSAIVDAVAGAHGGHRISGADSLPKRQATVDRFQTDPTVDVIALQIKAGGVGITLHAASDVLFLEQGWNPATHNQGEDRAHRIGQPEPVVIHYQLAAGTIDENIYRLVAAKRLLTDAIESGRIPDDYDPETAADSDDSILGDLLVEMAFPTRNGQS